MTAIAHVVLSAATRVQSKRVELAAQAAKTYVDGLRGGAIAAQTTQFNLLPVSISFKMLPLLAPQLAWQVCTALI